MTPTARCHTLDHAWYADRARSEIAAFADLVTGADLGLRVPTCPDWTLAGLLDHVGTVHRWAAHHVRVLAPERVPSASMDLGVPDDPALLPAWLAAGADVLVPVLHAADPDAPVWAWGGDRHVRFWSRRMLHETAVHRADAATALGARWSVEDSVAVDGVDEFLDNLPHAAYFAPGVASLTGAGESITLRADGVRWTVEFTPTGFTWSHAAAESAGVTVAGAPADLLLFAYGRLGADALGVCGDRALLDRWTAGSKL